MAKTETFFDSESYKQYMQELEGYPLLTQEEQQQLLLKIKNGDLNAKKNFINSNLRLVIMVAKRYINSGLPLEDLIQEGNLGLITAVDKFDISKGYKFSTYAVYWIRQSITRAIKMHGSVIRIPEYMLAEQNKIKKTIEILTQNLKRTPTINEIADYLQTVPEKVREIVESQTTIVSLQTPVTEDSDIILQDTIVDNDISVEDIVLDSITVKEIADTINQTRISQRDQEMFKKKCGILCGKEYTLEEIGQEYGISRERVRQITDRVKSKIMQNTIQPRAKSNVRKKTTIVHWFMESNNGGYSEEQIRSAIAELSTSDRRIITERDNNEPLSFEDSKRIYKIKQRLAAILESKYSVQIPQIITSSEKISLSNINKRKNAIKQKINSTYDEMMESPLGNYLINLLIKQIDIMVPEINCCFNKDADTNLIKFVIIYLLSGLDFTSPQAKKRRLCNTQEILTILDISTPNSVLETCIEQIKEKIVPNIEQIIIEAKEKYLDNPLNPKY